MLQQAYGYDYISRTLCYDWFTHFNVGRISTSENSRHVQPSTSISDDKVDKVHIMIHSIIVVSNT